MARKTQKIQDASSDDDAPETISHSVSRADAKRQQKVLHDLEADEKARRKTRNRKRDQQLKERAHLTKGGKTGERVKRVSFVGQGLDGGDEEDSDAHQSEGYDGVEARMLRAMRDAEDEMESGEGEEEEGEFKGFGQEVDVDNDMASGSDAEFFAEDDEDAVMSLGESDSIDPEAPTDDEEMDENGENSDTQLQSKIKNSGRKANYLADDLFAAAFASQDSRPPPKKNKVSVQQQTVKKRPKKSTGHPKDLVIGGRTIRTLPRLSDPRSQATARTVPSASARKFVDQSLAMEGKQALFKAKKRGWERRPANVGVMKSQGAPHGFARSIR